jgi:hypothetical protein
MTVVVGVDGFPDSFTAIRLAKQEASYRGVGLAAVMAYISDSTLGTSDRYPEGPGRAAQGRGIHAPPGRRGRARLR